ncbi:hypothetical protein ALT717_260009 [Alteromonas macleodii]
MVVGYRCSKYKDRLSKVVWISMTVLGMSKLLDFSHTKECVFDTIKNFGTVVHLSCNYLSHYESYRFGSAIV